MTKRVRTMDFSRSRELQMKAQRLIPGGAHTYSKGDDQFPLRSPGFIARGEGAYCWDVDGNRFLDWGMGLRSVILGHAYPPVIQSAMEWLSRGANFTRPSPVEVELAERIVNLIPSAEMVKFAKDGSDVTSGAVRLARAYTGRNMVARCREHPFFSFNDWFIGSTLCNSGVPLPIQELTVQFSYNDLASLKQLFSLYPNQIAAVVMEPVTTEPPAPGFLQAVRDLTHQHGSILIFDEIISGFRWHLNGAQTYFGVTPDLSTFGKAIGNGFSVNAVVGRKEIMELGGLNHDQPRVFLLSSTHGGETHALAAAVTTIDELAEKDVVPHLWRTGRALQDGFNEAARDLGVGDFVSMQGYPCSPFIVCKDATGQVSLEFRTLFLQEMIAHGVLIPWIAPSYSHGEREVEQTLEAARAAFHVYLQALDAGSASTFVEGPWVKPVFRKYN